MSYNIPIDFNDIPQIQNEMSSSPNNYDIIESSAYPKSSWTFPHSKDYRISFYYVFRENLERDLLFKKVTSNNNNTNDNVEDVEVKDNIEVKENIKKIQNNITNTNNRTTGETTLSKKIIKPKRVIKNKENMGRKKKGNSIKNIPGEKLNNKYRHDNVRIRYKRAFINYLIDFINLKIDKCIKLKGKGRLKKLHKDIIEKTKKQDILQMLNSSVRVYLSNDITQKYKKLKPENNKKVIDYIYEINEISIIEILEKSVNELMDIFCNDVIEDNIFKDFKRLKYYINNELIEVYNEKDDYIELFKDQAKNYKMKIENIDGRNEK